MKQFLFIPILLAIASLAYGQPMFTVTKKRPAQLDVRAYEKIAIGDIVGADGSKTERSMDLSDALTSQLFNTKAFEVIDRNALAEILSSQRGSAIKTIDQNTTAALSKKLNSALLVVGRIQNDKIYKEQESRESSYLASGCTRVYWWQLTGNIMAQIKIIDVKTGKMLFSDGVTYKVNLKTEEKCEAYSLGDTGPLLKEAINGLAKEISKIFLPYDEPINVMFEAPGIALFKNPFKKVPNAVASFQVNDYPPGLEILKAYADDKSLKPTLHEKAVFNYGLGLFIAGQYDQAAEQFKAANVLGSPYAAGMLQKIDVERQYGQKLTVAVK